MDMYNEAYRPVLFKTVEQTSFVIEFSITFHEYCFIFLEKYVVHIVTDLYTICP